MGVLLVTAVGVASGLALLKLWWDNRPDTYDMYSPADPPPVWPLSGLTG